MNDLKIQKWKRELYEKYNRCSLFTRSYVYIRIFTAPLFEIEKYVPKSGHILDVGCGSGIFSNILCIMSKDRSVIGFDASTKRIELAKNTIRNGELLSFYVQDVSNVNFNSFSIITIVDLLHHISYQ